MGRGWISAISCPTWASLHRRETGYSPTSPTTESMGSDRGSAWWELWLGSLPDSWPQARPTKNGWSNPFLQGESIRFWVLLLGLFISGSHWEGVDHGDQALTWFYRVLLGWVIPLPSPLLLEITQEWRQKVRLWKSSGTLCLSDPIVPDTAMPQSWADTLKQRSMVNNERKYDKCREEHY